MPPPSEASAPTSDDVPAAGGREPEANDVIASGDGWSLGEKSPSGALATLLGLLTSRSAVAARGAA